MMNKRHAQQALCGVVVVGAALAAINFPVSPYIGLFGLSAVIMVSGGTFPDIDSEGSHPTKSFGWLSHLLHSLIHLLTQALYHGTLGEKDRKKKGSHRLLTHTALGNIGAGAVLTGLCYIHQNVAAVVVGFLVGMAVAVWRKRWKWQAVVLGAIVAHATYDPSMLWVWGLAFTLGNMVHCFGDSCTLSGTPWFWPMMRNGKRWGASHALPEHMRIRTGTHNESLLMALTYIVTAGVVAGIFFLSSLI